MNYYKILGVREGASTYEIASAYSSIKTFLAQQSAQDDALMLEVETAAQTLLNPYERAEYDRMLLGEQDRMAVSTPTVAQPAPTIYIFNNRQPRLEAMYQLQQHNSQWDFGNLTFWQKFFLFIPLTVVALFFISLAYLIVSMLFF